MSSQPIVQPTGAHDNFSLVNSLVGPSNVSISDLRDLWGVLPAGTSLTTTVAQAGDWPCGAEAVGSVTTVGDPWPPVYVGDFPPPPYYGDPPWYEPTRIWPNTLPYVPNTLPWVPPYPPFQPNPVYPWPDGSGWQLTGIVVPSGWTFSALGDRCTAWIDMPGVRPADMVVTIENGTIKVVSKRFDTGASASTQQFIGNDFDPKTAEATLEAGVLTIVVMRFKEKLLHRVTVTAR